MFSLPIPFRLLRVVILGSAFYSMAQNKRDAALLGGTFLFGLGAIELVLRFGGL